MGSLFWNFEKKIKGDVGDSASQMERGMKKWRFRPITRFIWKMARDTAPSVNLHIERPHWKNSHAVYWMVPFPMTFNDLEWLSKVYWFRKRRYLPTPNNQSTISFFLYWLLYSFTFQFSHKFYNVVSFHLRGES